MPDAPTATRYTFDFVRRHLPPNARSVLEIGCGTGELASRLVEDGLKVVALDSDEDCAAEAKAKGVDARAASWPAPLDERFDSVLFTRSLHHIAPLDAAVDAAIDALRPGGAIIVEDFRFELDSRRTQAWFGGLMRLLDAGGLLDDAGLDAMLEKLDFGEQRHELHSSIAIGQSLARGGAIHEEDAAYYFRYVETHLGPRLTEQLLQYELALIAAGSIDTLGKRFVVLP